MEAQSGRPHERILILDDNQADLSASMAAVEAQFPEAQIVPSSSIQECKKFAEKQDFDVVICGYQLADSSSVELIHNLRLKDNEPGVLVLAHSPDPQIVAQVYNAGAHKFLIKSENWLDQIPSTIRHLIRVRRLEEENRRLLARLTEANLMLEEKNNRLDEFSATVAHDIRGPLAGISMKVEFLLDTYGASFEPRVQELLKRALDSAGRLTDIVQSMYEFARLGALAARMAEVDLSKLVDEVVSDLNVDARRDVKIGIGQLPTVWGNADLLRRVLINLVTNAIKYNDKPEVQINIGTSGTEQKSLARFASFYVEDNGPGIPKEEVPGLFALFARGSTAQHDSDGSGIGLAVVQRIVELHYGKIAVESKLREGTKFIVSLPMEKVIL